MKKKHLILLFLVVIWGMVAGSSKVSAQDFGTPNYFVKNGDTLKARPGLILELADNVGRSYKTFKTTPVTITNDTVFATTGSVFTKTLSASITMKLSGLSDGQIITVALTNTASNYTVAWSALGGLTLYWSGGSAPTMTTGAKTDIFSFQRIGNNIYAAYIQNY